LFYSSSHIRLIHVRAQLSRPAALSKSSTSVRAAARWRVLLAGCLAHVMHDGFTDMLYVFFPVWRASFHLSLAAIGLLRMLFSGSMSAFQIPSGILAGRTGIKTLLCAGTLLTSLALLITGFTNSALGVGVLLILGGMGSSTQHPLASSAIADAYKREGMRAALSAYNFSGDVGKFIVPGIAALLVANAGWHRAITTLGLFGIALIVIIAATLPGSLVGSQSGIRYTARRNRFAFVRFDGLFAFTSLSAIGIVDSATRTGFLTFLPFLPQFKGADVKVVGLAFSLIFAGGAAGKFVCGVLASRMGILRTVVVTELATTACIIAIIGLPLTALLFLCPLVGVALNGTSSVLYGTVPELAPEERRNEAFALFYTCGIGSGAIAPLLYGILSDSVGVRTCLLAVSLFVTTTVPLTIPLRGRIRG
jgi:MFS transporter, FSR family, fosmidomycin resistance protein